MSAKHLFYLASITKNAQSRRIELKSLWEPGGELYDVMATAAAGGGVMRWDPKSTAKDAWALCKSRHGAMPDATSVISAVSAPPAFGDGDDHASVFGSHGDHTFDFGPDDDDNNFEEPEQGRGAHRYVFSYSPCQMAILTSISDLPAFLSLPHQRKSFSSMMNQIRVSTPPLWRGTAKQLI